MLGRRHFLHTTIGAFGCFAMRGTHAQSRPLTKVRYNEVVRSMSFAPAYIAIARGFFKAEGLDVEITTGNGGDKSMAALLNGDADIALMGPEEAIYVLNSASPLKARIFAGVMATDGHVLVGRDKANHFDWTTLKGTKILGWRPGSTPLLYLEEALRLNGIDPLKDVQLVTDIPIPARTGAWLAGQTQYAIFNEPDLSPGNSSRLR